MMIRVFIGILEEFQNHQRFMIYINWIGFWWIDYICAGYLLTFILSKNRWQRNAWKILIEKADGFVQYCSNKEKTQFYGRNGELPIRDSLHLSPLAKVLQKIAEKQNKVGIIKMQLKGHQVEIVFRYSLLIWCFLTLWSEFCRWDQNYVGKAEFSYD